MKKIFIATALATSILGAYGQDAKPTLVTVNAKGDDVRSVIHDVFKQAGKNFVFSPGVRFILYMSLDNVRFEEALAIICKNASLRVEVVDNVYLISNNISKPSESKTTANPKQDPKLESKQADFKPTSSKPKGTLPQSTLAKLVTTRLQKVEIREVFAALGQQTGVRFEVAPDVPAFKMDAFLLRTSLRYALDEITGATKLKYRFTDQLTISIEK
jgi:type II secretory pathway component GspD/PulD (secretin)